MPSTRFRPFVGRAASTCIVLLFAACSDDSAGTASSTLTTTVAESVSSTAASPSTTSAPSAAACWCGSLAPATEAVHPVRAGIVAALTVSDAPATSVLLESGNGLALAEFGTSGFVAIGRPELVKFGGAAISPDPIGALRRQPGVEVSEPEMIQFGPTSGEAVTYTVGPSDPRPFAVNDADASGLGLGLAETNWSGTGRLAVIDTPAGVIVLFTNLTADATEADRQTETAIIAGLSIRLV